MKRATSIRSTRLADLIMRELALTLEQDVTDPRLELVTISGVALNADLSVARVLYTLAGDAARQEKAAAALEQAKGFLRKHLGKRLQIKFIPELRFERDTFLEDMVYARPDA
ncbi:30S ribosome-binding factor RbfA [Desulfolutivibrio sulfoxidireducens]|uniref:30S ribosome-binding factor RbfA n=1 Tax=Desulfolutivibrio sulfoxidireducens TaxID=2773299 RepID=UPI00159D5B25|nr:30S ribosome-binding factor RbfA [Desulfolutivibrio sulfoxidireducens]QLA16874.1 30S ribosome-binding factor RbfA [Desulfolutivibrio sulfoxidireducens]QLA20440.1 30S ribosome-binding factor RbfA [Desulfolutivibrio sulfoxidireducens]